MDYKKIIADSWAYTQENKGLIFWLGFMPALLTTTVSIAYILYQFFAFRSSSLFSSGDQKEFLTEVVSFVWSFFKTNNSLIVPLAVIGILLLIMYLLVPTFAKASAIQMIIRNHNGQKTSVGQAMGYGLSAFLKLFEYHLLIKTFAFFSIIFEMAFVLRNLGPAIFQFLLPVFLLFMVISVILTLLFTYADFFIVIDDEGIFDSVRKSSSMVVTHLKHTFLITILMILIGVRIVIQAIVVFLIPGLILVITGYVAAVTIPSTAVIVGSVLGIAALFVSAYMNGIVDIFSYTVWTYTFLNLKNEPPDLPEVQES